MAPPFVEDDGLGDPVAAKIAGTVLVVDERQAAAVESGREPADPADVRHAQGPLVATAPLIQDTVRQVVQTASGVDHRLRRGLDRVRPRPVVQFLTGGEHNRRS